jgi:very-short-patch-repair endonuclease
VLGTYAPTATRSELEEAFLELCDAYAIPRPVTNTVIEGFEVDAHWPAAKLVVELDGYAYHRSPEAFERDRARDVALTLAGLRVVRLTWRAVTADAARTAASIHRLIARAPSSPS